MATEDNPETLTLIIHHSDDPEELKKRINKLLVEELSIGIEWDWKSD